MQSHWLPSPAHSQFWGPHELPGIVIPLACLHQRLQRGFIVLIDPESLQGLTQLGYHTARCPAQHQKKLNQLNMTRKHFYKQVILSWRVPYLQYWKHSEHLKIEKTHITLPAVIHRHLPAQVRGFDSLGCKAGAVASHPQNWPHSGFVVTKTTTASGTLSLDIHCN